YIFTVLQCSTTPPIAATVFLGANDAALPGRTSEHQHVPIEEYKENLRKIVRHIKECSPTMLIVLITPPPIDEEGRLQYAKSLYGEKAMTLPERTNEVAGNYASACVEVAKELGVSAVNLWSKMQETQGWQKTFLSDGLHLTPDGNKVVFEEVVKVFNGAGLSALDMPSDFPHHSEIDHQNPAKVFQERGLL
ncbi:GDSL esterase/lipase At5g62930-like, partial [Bidens hawaiensis]|uniref:GDSL esterase/lipase At5g62930-like n=1 Tax=Bidens hawaiensis TaxID=980011 RepID=UPI00404B34B6